MLSNILKSATVTIGNTAVTFRGAVQQLGQTSDATRTLTLSTNLSSGNMLIAMTANRTTTAPALLSGYTDIVAINNSSSRSFRLQFKISTGTSETISWTGAYGYLASFANATQIGQIATSNSTATQNNPMPLVDISGLDTSGVGLILSGYYWAQGWTGDFSPYGTLSGNSSGFAVGATFNTASSISSETASNTESSALVNSRYTIELLP